MSWRTGGLQGWHELVIAAERLQGWRITKSRWTLDHHMGSLYDDTRYGWKE